MSMRIVRPSRFERDSDGDFVMFFRDARDDGTVFGPEHGPTSPLVSIEVARDQGGVICNPFDQNEVATLITTQSGSVYGAVLDRLQVNTVHRLIKLCDAPRWRLPFRLNNQPHASATDEAPARHLVPAVVRNPRSRHRRLVDAPSAAEPVAEPTPHKIRGFASPTVPVSSVTETPTPVDDGDEDERWRKRRTLFLALTLVAPMIVALVVLVVIALTPEKDARRAENKSAGKVRPEALPAAPAHPPQKRPEHELDPLPDRKRLEEKKDEVPIPPPPRPAPRPKRIEEEDDVRIPKAAPRPKPVEVVDDVPIPKPAPAQPRPKQVDPEPKPKAGEKPPAQPVAAAADQNADKALVENLLAQIKKRSAQDRIAALRSLARMGTKARSDAGQAVVDVLVRDTVPAVNQAAREALDKIDPEIADYVTTIAADKNPNERLRAIDELGKLGKLARNASPLLIYMVRTKDLEGKHALEALLKVAPDMDLENLLIAATRARYVPLRAAAIDGFSLLEEIKNFDLVIGAIVIRVASDQDASVRLQAAITLGKFGEKAKKAEPALRRATSDSVKAVRDAAKEALTKIGQ